MFQDIKLLSSFKHKTKKRINRTRTIMFTLEFAKNVITNNYLNYNAHAYIQIHLNIHTNNNIRVRTDNYSNTQVTAQSTIN